MNRRILGRKTRQRISGVAVLIRWRDHHWRLCDLELQRIARDRVIREKFITVELVYAELVHVFAQCL